MDLKQFKEKLFSLQPSLNDLLDEGYSHDGAMDIIDNEYVLKPKKNQNHYNSLLFDFLNNYNLEFFSIRNIFFNDVLHYINGYLIVGNIDGGYLGLNEKTGFIYIMYVDQLDSINTIFVENEVQFFEVLLIFAEYSTNGSEEEIENYVERCENICPSGNFDLFF